MTDEPLRIGILGAARIAELSRAAGFPVRPRTVLPAAV
jgi:hypothetical protein